MNWFLDTLMGYIMTDVVDVEFGRHKSLLSGRPTGGIGRQMTGSGSSGAVGGDTVGVVPLGAVKSGSAIHPSLSTGSNPSTGAPPLDFTTLRSIHTTYLERLLTGSLLANPALTNIIRMILEVCERFAAQVERWGGDVLPALLFEGSIAAGGNKVGDMVAERYGIVSEIDEVRYLSLLSILIHKTNVRYCFRPFTASSTHSMSSSRSRRRFSHSPLR